MKLPGCGSKYGFVLSPNGHLTRIVPPIKQASIATAHVYSAGIVAGTFTVGSGAARGCCHPWENHGYIAYPNAPARSAAKH
ncbi:MAG: hypothetical protein JOZ72_12265 [Alphaproteobacteria bacterium]|nr:hypothetical protein [Alphaproteobacteria bacterium]